MPWFRKFGVSLLFAACALALAVPASAAVCCKCRTDADPKTNICITTPKPSCTAFASASSNLEVNKLNCDAQEVPCKTTSEGGVCVKGPFDEATYGSATTRGSSQQIPVIAPELGIPIPGLVFASDVIERDGYYDIPFFAQYVRAAYTFLIGASALAAAVMIVWGGFLYIFGATGAKVRSGRQIIVNAVIGLALVLSAYAILAAVNPETLSLSALRVKVIQPEKIHIATVDPKVYNDILKNLPVDPTLPEDTCEYVVNQVGLPTAKSVYECAIKVAGELGIPPCYPVVALNFESLLAMPNSVGHDENAKAVGEVLPQARLNFLRTKISYLKKPFTVQIEAPTNCDSTTQSPETIKQCRDSVNQNVTNDDVIDPTKDDLGLDWRYSHGIGLSQFTISKPRGCFQGKCFSARQLFSPHTGTYAGMLIIKHELEGKTVQEAMNEDVAFKVWCAYAGKCQSNAKQRAVAITRCDNANPLAAMLPKQISICRGDLPLDRDQCESFVKANYPGVNTTSACRISYCDGRLPIRCGDPKKPCEIRAAKS